MKIRAIENEADWGREFEEGWLKAFQAHQKIDWKPYKYVLNRKTPSTKRIVLKNSKLLLVSSSGAYLKHTDAPFDASNILGDYSIRTFSPETAADQLDFAHEHYDTTAVRRDREILLPFDHLRSMVDHGDLGSLSETVVSFMGYQPDVRRVMAETYPQILSIVQKEQVDAVFLVPS